MTQADENVELVHSLLGLQFYIEILVYCNTVPNNTLYGIGGTCFAVLQYRQMRHIHIILFNPISHRKAKTPLSFSNISKLSTGFNTADLQFQLSLKLSSQNSEFTFFQLV